MDCTTIEELLVRTERRQQDLTRLSAYLHELESHLALVFAFSPDLILITNAEGTILRINYAVTKILGYRPEEVIGNTIWDYIAEDEVERMTKLHETLLKTNTFFSQDRQSYFFTLWKRKDGTLARLAWKFAYYDEANGWMIKFASDFTEIPLDDPFQATTILAAINHSTAGVVITDYVAKDNPIVYVNDSFVEMSGMTHTYLKGKNCRVLNIHNREQKAVKYLKERISQGQSAEVLLQNFKPDKTFWFNHLIVDPVTNSKGTVTHYIGSSRNVTEAVENGSIIWDPTTDRGFGRKV